MDLRKLSMPNLKKMDKKLINKLVLVLILIVIIFIGIIVFKLIIGNRTSYNNVENKMVKAAIKYYSENENGINSFKNIGNGTITVSTETLIENKYLKELTKLIPDKGKEISCKGSVSAKMNNGYVLYTPYLECNNYKTKKLNEVMTESIVEAEDGLYKVNDSYIFRGEYVNNFVSFADKIWRVLKINEDGSIRMIETTKREKIVWDDRYNIDTENSNGINDFNISRIKDSLIKLYEDDEEFNDSDKAYIVPQKLCIGKRGPNETNNSGEIECSEVVDNWMIGLIQVNEYLNASIDPNCQKFNDPQCGNYNYLKSLRGTYWSITPSTEKTSKVYKMLPQPYVTNAEGSAGIRGVILIDQDSIYVKGDGTEDNPYVFK